MRAAGSKGAGRIRQPSSMHWRSMRHQQLVLAPPLAQLVPESASRVMRSALFGRPVRGRALLAVADRWFEELAAMLPLAERHVGEVHFVTTADGPGLRPCTMDLLVVDPAVARLEALRPVLARGGALAVISRGGTVRWTRGDGPPRRIGRLGEVRR